MRSILIIGAGPSGLATAACLKQHGLNPDLVDRRGAVGGAYRHMHAGIVLASPARYTELPGYALTTRGEYVSVPEYREYLLGYAAHHGLEARKATVTGVERVDRELHVRFERDAHPRRYDAVVVATGMFDFPRWPAIDGFGPAATSTLQILHSSRWPGPASFLGKRVLIIGGATSAIEIAEECARAGLQPAVSVRDKAVKIAPQRFLGRDIHDFVTRLFRWLPRRLMQPYCAGRQSLPGTDLGFRRFCQDGVIGMRPAVRCVEGSAVVFADGTREAFDVVVAATGYRFDVPFLPPAVARAAGDGHPLADRCRSRSWPGLYVVGMPCVHRLSSEFLYGIADDARLVARHITRQLSRPQACLA